jgi:hypothetical protein
MKRKIFIPVILILLVSLILTPAIPALACGEQGCTPGFWKNHTDLWTGYSPDQTLESVFDVPDSYGLDEYTLLEALSFGGGSGNLGMAKNLLRAAVAALLNASHPLIAYPVSETTVILNMTDNSVTTNKLTLSREKMEQYKDIFDGWNNLGCPIDAHGNLIDSNFN